MSTATGLTTDRLVLTLRFMQLGIVEPYPRDVADLLNDLEALYLAAIVVDSTVVRPPGRALDQSRRFLLEENPERGLRLGSDPEAAASGLFGAVAAAPFKFRSRMPRLRRVRMESPLEVSLLILSGGRTLVWFLGALEKYFNMPSRIKTERVDLEARRAEREADAAEARLRAGRAQAELDALQARPAPFQLEEGELLPENEAA